MKILKIKINRKGTTLVEMLLYLGLLSMVMFFVTDIVLQTFNFMIEAQKISYLDADTRFIADSMRFKIQNSTSVSLPLNPGDSSSQLALVENGKNHTYEAVNGAFQSAETGGTYRLNSDQTKVNSFTVTNVSYSGKTPIYNVTYQITSLDPKLPTDTKNINLTVSKR